MRRLQILPIVLLTLVALVGCGSSEESSKDAKETDTKSAAIKGEGFTFGLPKNWEDITASVKEGQPALDVAVAAPTKDTDFRTNVNVIKPQPATAGTIEQYADQAGQELTGFTKTPVEPADDRTIDGEKAKGQISTYDQNGTELSILQYFVLHNEKIYLMTLTVAKPDEAAGKAALESVLASWKWA